MSTEYLELGEDGVPRTRQARSTNNEVSTEHRIQNQLQCKVSIYRLLKCQCAWRRRQPATVVMAQAGNGGELGRRYACGAGHSDTNTVSLGGGEHGAPKMG